MEFLVTCTLFGGFHIKYLLEIGTGRGKIFASLSSKAKEIATVAGVINFGES